ncbi:MAG: tRNA pseudouridine(38-40) synthase TruA [Bacteroidales bacterium]|nr:tRNA pseudouridine(38-40) synthase TruA [Bacteroidales bacterium]
MVKTRYFIRLAFDGTRYHGWQIQKNALTVQQVLNDACSMILRESVNVTGCGRTDTGVHAREFFAHFEIPRQLDWQHCQKLICQLNGFLESDIVIFDIFPVKPGTHARFSAIARTYYYVITRRKDPFQVNYSYYLFGDLDVDLMNKGADFLLSTSDFTSFSKVNTDTKTNICSVTYSRWEQKGDQLVFTIRADRFLRNMVRAIVGTLLEMGKGKITFDDFRQIVAGKNRSCAGESVPAAGLFLAAVEYPQELFKDL